MGIRETKISKAIMKAELEDYLLWKGKLGKIVATSDNRQVCIEILEPNKCEHCGGILPPKQIWVIPTSPLFQENAQEINSIKKQ